LEKAKQPLSRERVLAAAIGLADAHGIGAVTMRRVAEDLDCEAMSLYHHVADKRALLSGMAEAVLTEVVAESLAIDAQPDWRDAVRARTLAARRVMRRHPWAPGVVSAEAQSPFALFALYEQFVGTLIDAGFTYGLAHRAIHALGPLLLGFSNELFEPDVGDSGAPSEEEMAAIAEHMPHIAQMAAMELHESEGSLGMCDTQAEFEFTVSLVLDGLESKRVSQA
jgi:AcrR family transcriptional regulator